MSVWTRAFATYWGATSLSNLGSGVTLVALPLLAAQQLHAGAVELGYLRAVETVPYLLLALVVGQLADRLQPVHLMITADAVRAVLLGGIVGLAVTGRLTLPALYAAVFVVGSLTVTYDIAQFTFLPALVSREATVPATAAVELSRGAASTVGPGLGGLLTAVLRAGPTLLVDAGSYVVGAAALLTLRHRVVQRAPAAPRRRGSVTAGLRFVATHPDLRALTTYLGVNNVCNQAFLTGLLVYLEIDRHRPAAQVGLAFGAYGAGFLVAAALATPVGRRLGTGTSVTASSLLSAGGIALLAASAATPPAAVASSALGLVGAFVVGFAAPLFNVRSVALRLSVTPAALLGRVNAVVKLVSQGSVPLGAVAAGGLFAVLAPPRAFGLVAAVSLLATGILVGSPVVRGRRGPT